MEPPLPPILALPSPTPRARGPEVSASRPWTPDPETTPATCSTRPCNPFLALGSARAPSPPILSRADSYTPGPQQPVSEALSPSELLVFGAVETPPPRRHLPSPRCMMAPSSICSSLVPGWDRSRMSPLSPFPLRGNPAPLLPRRRVSLPRSNTSLVVVQKLSCVVLGLHQGPDMLLALDGDLRSEQLKNGDLAVPIYSLF